MNTVLITGTSRGIGKALKDVFEKRGACVIGYQRNELGDIRDFETIKKLEVIAQEKNVNILINNAGVYSEETMLETSLAEIREIIEVNLLAPMLLTKALWPTLIKQHGTLININSIAGRLPNEGELAYRSSKFGLTGFSGALFYAGKIDGVRVIDIPFAAVDTDMVKNRPRSGDNVMPSPLSAAKLVLQVLDNHDLVEIESNLLGGKIIDNGRVLNG